MGYRDGKVLGTEKIVGQGSACGAFNLVIVAEGYTRYEQDRFVADCDHLVDAFFKTPPLDNYPDAVSFYRIHVASRDSGARDPYCPPTCNGSGWRPRTFLDASFCSLGMRRLMAINEPLAYWLLDQNFPEHDHALVLVNSPELGGRGGETLAVSTAHCTGDWAQTAIHEFGHSLFGLDDEYQYFYGCDIDEPSQYRYTGEEPSAANITTDGPVPKWYLDTNTNRLPTTVNADCTRCDPQPDPTNNAIGTFEGAYWCHCGVFRAQFDCKMRSLDADFCAVCSGEINYILANVQVATNLSIDPGIKYLDPGPPYGESAAVKWDPAWQADTDKVAVTVVNQGTTASQEYEVAVFAHVVDNLTSSFHEDHFDLGVHRREALGGVSDGELPSERFSIPCEALAEAIYDSVSGPALAFHRVTARIESEQCLTEERQASSVHAMLTPEALRDGFSFTVENAGAKGVTGSLEIVEFVSDEGLGLVGDRWSPDGFPLESGESAEVNLRITARDRENVADALRNAKRFDIVQRFDGRIAGACTLIVDLRRP